MSYNFFYKLFSQCSPYHLWKTFIIIIIIKIVIILLCLFLACGCKKFNYSVCNSNLKHASVDVSQAKNFHNTLSPLVMFRWTEWECWKLLLLSFVELEQTGRGAGGGCKRSGVDVVPTHTHTHSCTWPWAVFAHLTRWLSEPRVNGDFVSGSVTSCTAVICQWWRLDYYREYKRWMGPAVTSSSGYGSFLGKPPVVAILSTTGRVWMWNSSALHAHWLMACDWQVAFRWAFSYFKSDYKWFNMTKPHNWDHKTIMKVTNKGKQGIFLPPRQPKMFLRTIWWFVVVDS